MRGKIIIHGKLYPVLGGELHLPRLDYGRYMYLTVEGGPLGHVDGLSLGHIEFTLLNSIDELAGKRMHVTLDGESYPDDSLGADIIGMGETPGWPSAWYVEGTSYALGPIRLDFQQLDGQLYRCRLHCGLRKGDPTTGCAIGPVEFEAQADFDCEVDELDPSKDD